MFLNYLPKDTSAYDIEPEDNKGRIIKQNYLTLDLDYKKGRCIIGNPPFGEKMYLAQQFYKKSILLGDYIAFILPISQLWNDSSLYEFDLIYSEDLGKQQYSDRKLHCCFNIYKRPINNELNKKKNNKLKDVEIVRQDSSRYKNINNYDLRMSYFGASAGKILNDNEDYCGVYKIIIHNIELKKQIIFCLHNIDWQKELNFIAQPKIQQFHIVKVLRKYIPNIA